MACEQGPTPDIPQPPLGTVEQWVKAGPEWARTVLGILTEERLLRAEEHDCLRRLRKADIIR